MTEFNRLYRLRAAAWSMRPLIHCLTNPIAMNDCANIILAAGGRPIMAEHREETEEITAGAKALVINTGNISDSRMEAIKMSARAAAEHKIPMIVDCVGAACSSLRRSFLLELLEQVKPEIIKGNCSELRALLDQNFRTNGVDTAVDSHFLLEDDALMVRKLAERYKTTAAATGAKDIVSDGMDTYFVENGCPELSLITGTGCMVGMLMGTYIAAGVEFDGAALSSALFTLAAFGLSGELAAGQAQGIGDFKIRLFDRFYGLSQECFVKRKQIHRM